MSRVPPPLGTDPFVASPKTPGSLGQNDAADPLTPESFVGDTPGPLGQGGDYADPKDADAPKFTWSGEVLFAGPGADTKQSLLADASAGRTSSVGKEVVLTPTKHKKLAVRKWGQWAQQFRNARPQQRDLVAVDVTDQNSILATYRAAAKKAAGGMLIISAGHGDWDPDSGQGCVQLAPDGKLTISSSLFDALYDRATGEALPAPVLKKILKPKDWTVYRQFTAIGDVLKAAGLPTGGMRPRSVTGSSCR